MVSNDHRAAPRGSGGVKYIGNYAGVFKAQKTAKDSGFNEALFLDSKHDLFVEEAGASNFFCFGRDGVLRTAQLESKYNYDQIESNKRGTILPGITRATIIELARLQGMKVEENNELHIETVLKSSEAFCSGTGAAISPVASITYKNTRVEFAESKVTKMLAAQLNDIQHARIPSPHPEWIFDPFAYSSH